MTTIRDILFGDLLPGPAGALSLAAEQAAEQLAASEAIPDAQNGSASDIARAAIARVSKLLDLQLNGVIVGGFQLGTALMKAARETAATPGSYRQVTVKTYTIPWDHEMDVDILLNRQKLASITFVAGLEITITGLAAIVRDGKITAITGGDTVVRVQLLARTTSPVQVDVPLAHAHREFELPAELAVPGDGIALVAGRS
jgi:hypothetical protein